VNFAKITHANVETAAMELVGSMSRPLARKVFATLKRILRHRKLEDSAKFISAGDVTADFELGLVTAWVPRGWCGD